MMQMIFHPFSTFYSLLINAFVIFKFKNINIIIFLRGS